MESPETSSSSALPSEAASQSAQQGTHAHALPTQAQAQAQTQAQAHAAHAPQVLAPRQTPPLPQQQQAASPVAQAAKDQYGAGAQFLSGSLASRYASRFAQAQTQPPDTRQ